MQTGHRVYQSVLRLAARAAAKNVCKWNKALLMIGSGYMWKL
jgi:hypothetical protein